MSLASLRRTGAMAKKELRHVLRDPSTLYLAFGIPLVLIVIFGYGVSFDLDRTPLAVVDGDHSPESRALARALCATGEFEIVAAPQDATTVEGLFRSRKSSVALMIPVGWSARLRRGEDAPVQFLLDGSDGTQASAILGAASRLVSVEASRLSQGPPLELRARLLYNPTLRSAVFFVPGLIAWVMALSAVLLTSLTIARESERGNLELLFSTPVSQGEIVVGKLLPYLAIGLLQALLVLAVGTAVFRVPIEGSLVLLFAAAFVFLVGMLGQGLLISVVTRSQQVATQVGAVSSLLPTLILSGFLFPVEGMPWPLQVISSLFPARYFITILRGVLLRGNGLSVLWPEFLSMAVFAVAVLALAVARFQRRLS